MNSLTVTIAAQDFEDMKFMAMKASDSIAERGYLFVSATSQRGEPGWRTLTLRFTKARNDEL